MRGDDAPDVVLVADVRGDAAGPSSPSRAQLLVGRLELLGPARGERHGVALLARASARRRGRCRSRLPSRSLRDPSCRPLLGCRRCGAIQSRDRVDSASMPRLLAILLAARGAVVLRLGRRRLRARARRARRRASPADFPSAEGKTLAQLNAGPQGGRDPRAEQRRLAAGRHGQPPRLRDRRPREQADRRLRGRGLHGQARRHASCAGRSSRARSRSTSPARIAARRPTSDLASGKTFYVARRRVRVARARTSRSGSCGSTAGSSSPTRRSRCRSGAKNGPPDVGDKAIRVAHADARGRRRQPQEALDARPAAAGACSTRTSPTSSARSPSCCCSRRRRCAQSRTCGPVVDIAEQVRAQNGKGVTFIQQEIYKDNDAAEAVRPQVAAVAAADASRGRSSSTARARSPRASRASSRRASSRAPSSACK